MKRLGLAFLAAACAASAALAQTAGSPGGVTTPSPATPSPVTPAAPGGLRTPTNPTLGGTPGSTLPGSMAGTGGITDSSNSVAAQAQQRRQLALQQCQSLTGSSRNDCVRAADDDFARAVGSDTLAQQGQGSLIAGTQGSVPATGGVAGNTRSTPDVSPTPRDSTIR
jgi:hypothetical protein